MNEQKNERKIEREGDLRGRAVMKLEASFHPDVVPVKLQMKVNFY